MSSRVVRSSVCGCSSSHPPRRRQQILMAASHSLLSGHGKLEIGFLIFAGYQTLDLHGPLELMDTLQKEGKANFLTVAKSKGPVASAQGPALVAQYDYQTCPTLDLLIVPGGPGTRTEIHSKELIGFLQQRYPELKLLLSVCTGAALLGAAGLLDGRRATTNKLSFHWVASVAPKADWVKVARWVEDGNIITAAGVSAGMDMSLHVLHKFFSPDLAAEAARYAEYRWDAQASSDDPFGYLVDSPEQQQ